MVVVDFANNRQAGPAVKKLAKCVECSNRDESERSSKSRTGAPPRRGYRGNVGSALVRGDYCSDKNILWLFWHYGQKQTTDSSSQPIELDEYIRRVCKQAGITASLLRQLTLIEKAERINNAWNGL